MWLEAITKSPSSASSTHIEGSFDECLLVTAKRKNWLLHSQFSLTSTAVTRRQEKTLNKMLSALRIAMSSDKLLLHNSQKEHSKTNMEDGNTTPMLWQFSNGLPSGMHNINMKWKLVSCRCKRLTTSAGNPPTQKWVCSCHHYSFVLAVSRFSILFQDVWWQQLNFSNKCNPLLSIFLKS